ncbi:hypothetical protein [Asticcacaulis sp.]|uniref:hypothetical protein n=1 Tax=Asticcacaulis sp. TaxID=1872648 RepID=UPI00263077BF|nr:hypothetical protein [Asticcacaulis sp.]
MGGKPSRPKASATELLKYACDVAISSNAACISQAQATVTISITGAANVTFKNDNLSTNATATTDCSQSININVPSMQNTVQQAIKQLAGTHISDDATLTNLSSSVSRAMTQQNVQKAIADAIDAFKISLKATGNVDVVNFNVSQVATSNLNNIVQNMSITTDDGSSASVANDLQKKLDTAMASAPPCPSPQTDHGRDNVHYASYAALIVILLLLVSSFVFIKKSSLP